jgi:hypothetical protein
MNKLIDFDSELVGLIQAHANKYFNGNFSMAVRHFCNMGLYDDVVDKQKRR